MYYILVLSTCSPTTALPAHRGSTGTSISTTNSLQPNKYQKQQQKIWYL